MLAIVRLRGNRKAYFHNRQGHAVSVGQFVVVEADRGRDLGQVSYLGRGRQEWWDQAVHQGILAVATAEDLDRVADLRREEREAWDIGLEKIQDHGLGMQLVGIERRWDRGKLTFFFLAEGRVDFRALVRDLAGIFRTRIELRQIGVRDEARLKGGLGVCGRVFCCASFLDTFESVTLRMAKDQQLALNPIKLSGPCGRLRCCLAYEDTQYRDSLGSMPRLGSHVVWQGRPGRVRKLDPLRELVTVQLTEPGADQVDVPPGELDFNQPALDPDSERTEAGRQRRQRRPRGPRAPRRGGPREP
ncbi:MAG: regulatory iron-sulfur-containing complex subunit RicT [Candidatus Krumholzibacteriia bacterium]